MYNYNEALFSKESELKYYLLGLILADGYISRGRRNSYRIEVALAEKDRSYLETVRDIICPNKPLKYKQKQKAYKLTIDNKNIYDDIIYYVSRLPVGKYLTFPYGIPDKYLPDFIRGYSDGDGSIGVVRGQKKFNGKTRYYYGLRYRLFGTQRFLEGVSINLKRLEIVPNLVRTHKKKEESCYYIEYGFKSASRVLEALYKNSTIRLERKFEVYQKILNTDSNELEKLYGTPEGCYNTRNAKAKV